VARLLSEWVARDLRRETLEKRRIRPEELDDPRQPRRLRALHGGIAHFTPKSFHIGFTPITPDRRQDILDGAHAAPSEHFVRRTQGPARIPMADWKDPACLALAEARASWLDSARKCPKLVDTLRRRSWVGVSVPSLAQIPTRL
jgi:hypothetical protein